MFKCKKQKYRFIVAVVVVFNRKDGSLKLKIKCFIIWNEDMECTFFCFLGISWARPPTFIICPLWRIFKNESFSNWLQDMNCPIFVGQFKEKWWGFSPQKSTLCDHIQLRSVPADFFIHQWLQHHDKYWCWQSKSLPVHHFATKMQKKKIQKKKNVDGLHLQVNILHKKWRGNSMCH